MEGLDGRQLGVVRTEIPPDGRGSVERPFPPVGEGFPLHPLGLAGQEGEHFLRCPLQDVGRVHEGVAAVAAFVHRDRHPACALAQEVAEPLAHHRAPYIDKVVGAVGRVVADALQHLVDGLCRAEVVVCQLLLQDDRDPPQRLDVLQRFAHDFGYHLSEHDHRLLPAEEVGRHVRDPCGIGHGTVQEDAPLVGELQGSVAGQRFADGDIDVYRSAALQHAGIQRLVDKPVAVPPLFVVVRFGQRDALADMGCQRPLLVDGLSVLLVDPLCRSVGREDDQRPVLVAGFGDGRCRIEQCRSGRDADGDRLVLGQRHAQCHECRRPLVGHGVARNAGAGTEIVDDGRVAGSGTDYGLRDASLQEQGGEDVYVFFGAVHRRG